PSTSSIDERVMRMWAAAKYHPSAKAGMRTWASEPDPEDGSHPRYTEKKRIITSPTQNDGSDRPSREKTFPRLSHQPLTRTAAMMPVGMPMISEKPMATTASRSELGRRDRYSSSTGVR